MVKSSSQKSVIYASLISEYSIEDRRRVLYSRVLVTGVNYSGSRHRVCYYLLLVVRGGCPHVVLLWVLAHVQTLSYAGGCVVSSHTQQSFAKLGLGDLARPFATSLPCLTCDPSPALFPILVCLIINLLDPFVLKKKTITQALVTNLWCCASRTLLTRYLGPVT